MAFSRQALVISKNTLYGGKFAESSYFVVHQNLVNLSQPVFNCPFDTGGHFVCDDLNEIRGKCCGCQSCFPFLKTREGLPSPFLALLKLLIRSLLLLLLHVLRHPLLVLCLHLCKLGFLVGGQKLISLRH